jgi:hypothetical protein
MVSTTLIAISLLTSAHLPGATKTTVKDLLQNPKLDNHDVVVRGKIHGHSARSNREGKPYFLFSLEDGKQSVHVFGYGKLPTEDTDNTIVNVTGKYARERKVGRSTYHNEIEVDVRNGRPEVSKAG